MTAAGNCAAKLFRQSKHCAYCNSVTDVSDNTALSTAFKAVARKAHPDKGGSNVDMRNLHSAKAAWEKSRQHSQRSHWTHREYTPSMPTDACNETQAPHKGTTQMPADACNEAQEQVAQSRVRVFLCQPTLFRIYVPIHTRTRKEEAAKHRTICIHTGALANKNARLISVCGNHVGCIAPVKSVPHLSKNEKLHEHHQVGFDV